MWVKWWHPTTLTWSSLCLASEESHVIVESTMWVTASRWTVTLATLQFMELRTLYRPIEWLCLRLASEAPHYLLLFCRSSCSMCSPAKAQTPTSLCYSSLMALFMICHKRLTPFASYLRCPVQSSSLESAMQTSARWRSSMAMAKNLETRGVNSANAILSNS